MTSSGSGMCVIVVLGLHGSRRKKAGREGFLGIKILIDPGQSVDAGSEIKTRRREWDEIISRFSHS